MRIIGGTAGGRLLRVPKGYQVRPTPDLVRQAIFNSLGPRVEDANVLELFAGTGALSLECLSRGALSAVCVEKARRHAEVIRRNLVQAGLDESRLRLRVQDALTVPGQMAAEGQRFDLVLADPPFGEKNVNQRSSSFAQQLLDNVDLPQVLKVDGLFILGHARRDSLTLPPVWNETKMLRHGDSTIRFLRKA